MDAERFDALVRSVPTVGSRRHALAALTGVLGVTLGASFLGDAEAKKRKPCPPCKKRKKGKCKKRLPDGTVCGPDQVCSGGACIMSACGAGGPCRVFLSSTLYTGNLGGLSGADAKCQGLAAAAGLPGTYKAWLSDTTSSVISRFLPSSRPYRLVNGTTIAANFTDLTDGALAAPINVTETGGGPGGSTTAWTDTAFDGNVAVGDNHCQNWSNQAGSGANGNVNETNTSWALFSSTSCNTPLHLYCFQQS